MAKRKRTGALVHIGPFGPTVERQVEAEFRDAQALRKKYAKRQGGNGTALTRTNKLFKGSNSPTKRRNIAGLFPEECPAGYFPQPEKVEGETRKTTKPRKQRKAKTEKVKVFRSMPCPTIHDLKQGKRFIKNPLLG